MTFNRDNNNDYIDEKVCFIHSLKVFEEEHHILYLDHGGVIVAIKDTSIPLKILK